MHKKMVVIGAVIALFGASLSAFSKDMNGAAGSDDAFAPISESTNAKAVAIVNPIEGSYSSQSAVAVLSVGAGVTQSQAPGTGGHQYITGTGGHQYITGTGGHQYITGTGGHQYITGTGGHQYITGTGGHQYITGTGGHQ